jgi:hypothetical protein
MRGNTVKVNDQVELLPVIQKTVQEIIAKSVKTPAVDFTAPVFIHAFVDGKCAVVSNKEMKDFVNETDVLSFVSSCTVSISALQKVNPVPELVQEMYSLLDIAPHATPLETLAGFQKLVNGDVASALSVTDILKRIGKATGGTYDY